MILAELSSTVLRKLRREGLIGVLSGLKRMMTAPAASSFDQAFGTDTETMVPLWRLHIDSNNRSEGIRYQTMDPDEIRIAIASLPIHYEDFVFVDLGSGKGRCLLIASELPFKKVVGVEFSSELNRIAISNIAKYPTHCSNVLSLHGDAALYDFPPDNLVIYLYHPFDKPVFCRVLDNLERSFKSVDREVFIVYFNPKFANLLDESGLFRRIDLPTSAAIYTRANGLQSI
jgi:Histone methylation protein DOT1